MKIIVNPEWTFMEALEAAWKAYSGSGIEHSVSNRIRVLEQWANVVGRQKAVSQFEATLALYKNQEEIRKYLGLSEYTVKKLRKQFRKMPMLTPFSEQPNRYSEENNEKHNIDTRLEQFLTLARKAKIDPIAKLISYLLKEESSLIFDEILVQQILEVSQRTGVNIVARLINWMAETAQPEDVINILENLEIRDLRKLSAAVGLSNLKSVLAIWQVNKGNDSEEFWQTVLSQNSFIFAQLFSFPVILIQEKAYVGGKNIANKGGNIIDFLCLNHLTGNIALIEIKTPVSKLLGSKYRGGVYNISSDLSGSVIQISNYKNSLLQNYMSLVGSEEDKLDAFNPKCIVIIGNIHAELQEQRQRKSLELFRMGLKDIQIITYDELFGKIEFLVGLLEGQVDE